MGYLNTGQFKKLQDMYISWSHYPKFAFRNFTGSAVYSANLPALFGVVWFKNDGSVTEGIEASASNSFISSGTTYGDVVNINFYVFASRLPRYLGNLGFNARAMAMTTLCLIPPDNSCG